MAETVFKLNPPDLGTVEALAQFPPDADLVNPDYSGQAFSDLRWHERSYPQVRFEMALFKNGVLSKTKLRSAVFEDVRFTACDLSGADWSGSQLSRVEFISSRLTGFVGAEGRYEHVLWRACKLDYALFQMARLTRCCFEKCDLTNATFEGATVGHVAFRDCNLANARFVRSKLSDVDMRGSRIDGLEINLEDLRGLRIDLSQTPVIASLTGVVIEKS
jgi:uncharacterized protein YjbI with pentapeptide repeats